MSVAISLLIIFAFSTMPVGIIIGYFGERSVTRANRERAIWYGALDIALGLLCATLLTDVFFSGNPASMMFQDLYLEVNAFIVGLLYAVVIFAFILLGIVIEMVTKPRTTTNRR